MNGLRNKQVTKWLVMLLILSLLVPTSAMSVFAEAPKLFLQDGRGFSGESGELQQIAKPVMTGYSSWPAEFSVGSSKNFASAVSDGSNLWLIPSQAQHVVKLNPETGEMAAFNSWPAGFNRNTIAFGGGVFDGTYVWMIPWNGTHLVRLDPQTGDMVGYNSWPVGCTKGAGAFAGGIFDGTHVWLVPSSNDCLIKVNASNGEMSSVSWPFGFAKSWQATFSSGVFDGTYLWLIPGTADRVIRVNTSSGAATHFDSWPAGTAFATGNKFVGGTFDGKNVWLVPFGADRLVKLNATSGTMTGYNAWPEGFNKTSTTNTSTFFGGVFDGTNLWLVPHDCEYLIRFNTLTGKFTHDSSWPSGFVKGKTGNTFQGGIYVDGSVWLIPGSADRLLKISNVAPPNVAPTDIALSNQVVQEGAAVETTVGVLSATDPNGNQGVTFSLVSTDETPGTDNDYFWLDGATLKTKSVFYADLKAAYKIAVRATDSDGLTFDKALTITIAEPNVKLSRDNKKITVTFNEVVANASTATTATAKGAFLRGKVTISTNNSTSFVPLDSADAVVASGNKLTVTLKTALETANNRIKIAAGAVKDGAGTANEELTSGLFHADKQAVQPVESFVSSGNQVVTVRFNENVFGTQTGTAAAKSAALRGAVQLATDGATYAALASTAKVAVSGSLLVVSLPTALTGATNRLKIAAGALADRGGTLNTEVTTDALTLDQAKPTVVKTRIVSSKAVAVDWSEPIVRAGAMDALKASVNVSSNNGITYYGSSSIATISISKRTMVVAMTTPIFSAANNKVKVLAGAVKDLAGAANDEFVSATIASDTFAPTIRTASLSSDNKTILITFNEPVTAKATSLRTALKLVTDGETLSALASKATVTLSGSQLKIVNPTALSGSVNRVVIAASAVQDVFGNVNAESVTNPLPVETTKPTIISAALAGDNKTITVKFSEKVAGTGAGTAVQKAIALKAALQWSPDGTIFGSFTGSHVVTLSGDTLTVKLATAPQGNMNRLRINAMALADAGGNKNDELTTGPLVVNTAPPALVE